MAEVGHSFEGSLYNGLWLETGPMPITNMIAPSDAQFLTWGESVIHPSRTTTDSVLAFSHNFPTKTITEHRSWPIPGFWFGRLLTEEFWTTVWSRFGPSSLSPPRAFTSPTFALGGSVFRYHTVKQAREMTSFWLNDNDHPLRSDLNNVIEVFKQRRDGVRTYRGGWFNRQREIWQRTPHSMVDMRALVEEFVDGAAVHDELTCRKALNGLANYFMNPDAPWRWSPSLCVYRALVWLMRAALPYRMVEVGNNDRLLHPGYPFPPATPDASPKLDPDPYLGVSETAAASRNNPASTRIYPLMTFREKWGPDQPSDEFWTLDFERDSPSLAWWHMPPGLARYCMIRLAEREILVCGGGLRLPAGFSTALFALLHSLDDESSAHTRDYNEWYTFNFQFPAYSSTGTTWVPPLPPLDLGDGLPVGPMLLDMWTTQEANDEEGFPDDPYYLPSPDQDVMNPAPTPAPVVQLVNPAFLPVPRPAGALDARLPDIQQSDWEELYNPAPQQWQPQGSQLQSQAGPVVMMARTIASEVGFKIGHDDENESSLEHRFWTISQVADRRDQGDFWVLHDDGVDGFDIFAVQGLWLLYTCVPLLG
jgi:hypothetical protein